MGQSARGKLLTSRKQREQGRARSRRFSPGLHCQGPSSADQNPQANSCSATNPSLNYVLAVVYPWSFKHLGRGCWLSGNPLTEQRQNNSRLGVGRHPCPSLMCSLLELSGDWIRYSTVFHTVFHTRETRKYSGVLLHELNSCHSIVN